MKLFSILLVAVVVCCISCKKVYPTTINEVHYDTTIVIHNDTTIISNYDTTIYASAGQYRYQLPDMNTGDTLYTPQEEYGLQRFNIDYFPGVDSVFYTFGASGQNGFGTQLSFQVELYNITDSMAVPGSLINVVPGTMFYQSGNFAASLPHKEVTLAIRTRFNDPTGRVGVFIPTIWLYRK